ncbi:MAG TPA: hypothetical protein VF787_25545 [Thermoanaerobaculia bacterium]
MKQSNWLAVLFVSLLVVAAGPQVLAQCTTPFASQPSPPSSDDVWIDDSLPSGASVTVGSLNWDTSQYATGSQSFRLNGAGTNSLRIEGINEILKFGSGKAIFYVLTDPCDMPREIKVTYRSTFRTAVVYWGDNLISGGTKFRRGNVPAGGTWTRLEVPISSPLNMQGQPLEWIQIETYDGRTWFDHVGTDDVGCLPSVPSQPSIPGTDDVWIDDDIPVGSYLSYGEWYYSQAASGTLSLAYPFFGASPISVVRVDDLSLFVDTGTDLITYVMPTSCATLSEIKITWYAGTLSGSAYWGSTGIGGESTAVYMGANPSSDVWTRLEVPASLVGLEGQTITSIKVETRGTQVWVDSIGIAP